MRRTQIYLTEKQLKALKTLRERLGCSQSDIIREAIDRLVAQYQEGNRLDLLRQARGIWADGADLPDFRALRLELERQ